MFNHEDKYVFNCLSDPCEFNNLAFSNLDIVEQLLTKLVEYQKDALPVWFPERDYRANPPEHQGYWGPWMTSKANSLILKQVLDGIPKVAFCYLTVYWLLGLVLPSACYFLTNENKKFPILKSNDTTRIGLESVSLSPTSFPRASVASESGVCVYEHHPKSNTQLKNVRRRPHGQQFSPPDQLSAERSLMFTRLVHHLLSQLRILLPEHSGSLSHRSVAIF